MRKHVEPEVFEYYDCATEFETTDKELAIVVFEYAMERAKIDYEESKKSVVADYADDIKRLKKEIKEEANA